MFNRKYSIALIMLISLAIVLVSSANSSKGIKIISADKEIEVDGIVSRDIGKHPELQGAIEFLACAEGGKSYESIFVLQCEPKDLYDALIRIGLKPGAPAHYDESEKRIMPEGDKVRIFVRWENPDGDDVRFRAEDLIFNKKKNTTMQHVDWVFAGSKFMEDPGTGKQVLQAELTRSIASTHHGDQSVILQNPLPEATDESLYKINDKLLPKPGTKVKFIIDGSSYIQVHVFITGEVQGVCFRDYTKQMADQLGVYGYVENLPDGKVEAVLEGAESAINKLLEKLRVGPEAAKVMGIKTEKREFSGKYKDFQIHQ